MSGLARAYPSRLQPGAARVHSCPARLSAQVGILALIPACILAPPIHVTPELWIRPEQIALPLVFLVYVWLLLAGRASLIRFNGMFVVGFLFCSAMLVSTWYGAAFLQHRVIDRDFLELPKSLLPVAFFTIAYEANLSETAIRRVFDVFGIAILLICLYAWGQWMNVGLTQTLNPYYSALNHDSALHYARRVYATMGNPNILGELMSWSLVAFLLAWLFRVGSSVKNLLLALATLITIVMTGSRYAVLTTVLGIALVFAFKPALPAQQRRRRILFVAIVPLLALVSGFAAFSNARTLDRFLTLEHPLQTDSLRGRVEALWVQPWTDFLASPYLGHGPEKSVYTGVITDSEFLDIVRKFGLMGLALYLAYFLFPLWLMWRGLLAERSSGPYLAQHMPATAVTLRLGLVMATTALVMNVGMSTLTNVSLQGFLWIWLGLGAASGRISRVLANEE